MEEAEYRIRNWKEHQHYQDNKRKPLWIKVYRRLLDDIDWHGLDGDAAKTLVMLWLLASEDDTGDLPPLRVMAFRLRMDAQTLLSTISRLSPWIERLDSKPLAGVYQDACLDKDKDKDKDKDVLKEQYARARASTHFAEFWQQYPKKRSKGQAERAWQSLKPSDTLVDAIMAGLLRAKTSREWSEDGGKYIPHAATWLRAKGWEDDYTEPVAVPQVDRVMSANMRAAQQWLDAEAAKDAATEALAHEKH